MCCGRSVSWRSRSASAMAAVELWTSLGDDVDAIDACCRSGWLGGRGGSSRSTRSVADTWRAHAEPVWVDDDLVICPAWVPFEAAPGVTVLRIEPGSTFGLGDHPTTMLSMRALRAVAVRRSRPCSTSDAARACSPSARACSVHRVRRRSTSRRRRCRSRGQRGGERCGRSCRGLDDAAGGGRRRRSTSSSPTSSPRR